jgi:uridine kinase
VSQDSRRLTRAALLDVLAESISALGHLHPIRVAIDGPDAAGKSTLADELGAVLQERGRMVIRASVDDFHLPRVERWRRGSDSPQGYYYDSFDLPALRKALLDPLGPGGSREYRRVAFDLRNDAPVSEPAVRAPKDAVLLLDGIFLLRPELVDEWDLRIFVSVGFDEILRRAMDRDAELLGSPEEVARRYRARYIPGQQLYFAEARPLDKADFVVWNDDPTRPSLVAAAGSGRADP